MISLADLRARNVEPTWQEAVAVIQELLQTVIAASGPTAALPDLDHVALIANGDVVALPGARVAGHPVRHVGTMLGLLLQEASPPTELSALVERATTSPPQFAGIDEFSKALSFFERPGRRGDVERLVSRVMSTEAQSRADEELRRLKERTAQAAERAALDETVVMAGDRRRSRLPLIIVAALVMIGIAAAVFYRLHELRLEREARAVQAQAAPPGPSQAAGAKAPEDGALADGEAANPTKTTPADAAAPDARAAAGAPPAQADGAEPEPSFVARAAEAVRSTLDALMGERAKTAGAAPASVAEAAAPAPKPRPRPQRPEAPPEPSAAVQPVAPTEVAETTTAAPEEPAPMSTSSVTSEAVTVYTSADPSVLPPVMLRPMLPASPPPSVPPSQVGTLELVIDETGEVEQVKLSSPANRYEERMLVSHAKTWRFKPAMRDGHPVKYRTRVRVTI